MRVGIISYYDYEKFLKPEKKVLILENWHKAWKQVFDLSEKNNIKITKYYSNNHSKYDKIIFLEIPRINDLLKVLFLNLFKNKVSTILVVNETFLGRARYMLRIPFLFNKVLINSEDKIKRFMSYKVDTFSYPSLPIKEKIIENKSSILNPKRKKKLVFIGSFKIALSVHGTYIYRYNLVKKLTKEFNYFDLYGKGWDRTTLPFDMIGIAIVIKFQFLKKIIKTLMKIRFKPLGRFPIAKSKFETLKNYDFALAIEPTKSKFNSICEKIFDPMLSGSIPIYYGQEIHNIPKNTYIRIDNNSSIKEIVDIIKNFPEERKSAYRRNIYKFLNSNAADRYRYSTYANLLINAILF